jgi:hypothetical protein
MDCFPDRDRFIALDGIICWNLPLTENSSWKDVALNRIPVHLTGVQLGTVYQRCSQIQQSFKQPSQFSYNTDDTYDDVTYNRKKRSNKVIKIKSSKRRFKKDMGIKLDINTKKEIRNNLELTEDIRTEHEIYGTCNYENQCYYYQDGDDVEYKCYDDSNFMNDYRYNNDDYYDYYEYYNRYGRRKCDGHFNESYTECDGHFNESYTECYCQYCN